MVAKERPHQIITMLELIYGRTRRPVRTVAISVQTGIPERTVRYWLNQLERLGIIRRVDQRKGWILAAI